MVLGLFVAIGDPPCLRIIQAGYVLWGLFVFAAWGFAGGVVGFQHLLMISGAHCRDPI